MIRRLPLLKSIFAVCLILFVIAYFGYYAYVGIYWGFSDRMLMLLVSDSVFLLFIPVSVGVLLKKSWGWWLTVVIFIHLFIAKCVAIAAEFFFNLSGGIVEPFQPTHQLAEVLFLVFYTTIIMIFSLDAVKREFSVERRFGEWYWRALLWASGLYTIHFMLALITFSLI